MKYIPGILCLFSSFAFSKDLNFEKENYFIKKDYVCRNEYYHFDDKNYADKCQNEVYQYAKKVLDEKKLNTIADIGCGSGYKLDKYFKDKEFRGYEIEPTLKYLRDTYPKNEWIESNLSLNPKKPDVDLIICSDVVEHLVKPDELLNFINKFNFKYLVISTPDRSEVVKAQGNLQGLKGPPLNKAHMREWSFEEFKKYISQYFHIEDHIHTKKEFWGQVILATKKSS